MSYSQTISSHLDKVVSTFIDKIVSQHPILNKDDLMMLWNGGAAVLVGVVKNNGSSDNIIIPKELSILSKTELVELCKTKKLKHTGTKQELLTRIVESENQAKTQPLITPKLVHKTVPPIALHRNKFGNFEHMETNFVFNEKTEKVYGKQNSDGSISQLSSDDINICNKYKFSFDIPSNLQQNSTADKVLTELDDDEEEVEVEVEEEEEEQEEEEEEIEIELEEDE